MENVDGQNLEGSRSSAPDTATRGAGRWSSWRPSPGSSTSAARSGS